MSTTATRVQLKRRGWVMLAKTGYLELWRDHDGGEADLIRDNRDDAVYDAGESPGEDVMRLWIARILIALEAVVDDLPTQSTRQAVRRAIRGGAPNPREAPARDPKIRPELPEPEGLGDTPRARRAGGK